MATTNEQLIVEDRKKRSGRVERKSEGYGGICSSTRQINYNLHPHLVASRESQEHLGFPMHEILQVRVTRH